MEDSKKAAALLKRLGADKIMKGVSYYDDGFMVFVLTDWGLNAGLRPARLLTGETNSHLDADNSEVFALMQLPLLENLIRRLQNSPLSAGEFEANPRSSVPALVAEVKAELGVSEAAAMAFLQTLAMPDPSTKNLRIWNDWSAAVYKKSFAELVEKGVVLEAKRARSGRSFFLDGPWLEFTSPRKPIEEWKLSMMPLLASENDMNFPSQPAHELFEKAWTRWRDGGRHAG